MNAPIPDPDDMRRARKLLLEEGYCIVDGMLADGYVEKLRLWSDHWLDNTKFSPKWKYQGSDIHLSGNRHRSKRMPELPADEIIDELIEHPKDILSAMGLGDFKSGGTFQIISKPPGAPPLYWHQDWARWDDPISMSPWPQQVFLNWYLTDTTARNGCLRVIPKSHLRRLDIHSHLVNAHEGGGYEIEESNEWMFFDHPDAVDVPIKVGQLVIADARMLHGTYANQDSVRRTVLLGWFYRRSNEVPAAWKGKVPMEIQRRDPDLPFNWNRQPGKYLRPAATR